MTTQEIITEHFNNAPQVIQDYLQGDAFATVLQNISRKHRLHIDQASALENELVLVLLGLEHPNDLLYNLRQAELPAGIVELVIQDVDEQILKVVRESLIELHTNRERAALTQSPKRAPRNTPKPAIDHSSLQGVHERLTTNNVTPREEKELPKAVDPYREPIE